MGSRGVWSLGNVQEKYPQGDWVNYQNVFLDLGYTSAYCVFPGDDGAIKKFNTVTGVHQSAGNPVGNPSDYKEETAGGGSTTKTYWAGGGQNNRHIAKLDYSTETSTSAFANLPWGSNTNNMGVASKLTDVYYVGGGPSLKSRSGKLTFATETSTALPSSNYINADAEMAAITGGSLYPYAYFWGGTYANLTLSNLIKLTYSNETFSVCPASLQFNDDPSSTQGGFLRRTSGKLGTTTQGYFVGGLTRSSNGNSVFASSLAKLTYSGETFSKVPSGSLPYEVWSGTSATTESDKGLYTCGQNPSYYFSNTHLLTFSNESWSSAPSLNVNTVWNHSLQNAGTSARDSQYPVAKASGLITDRERWFDSAPTTDNNAYIQSDNESSGGSSNYVYQKVDMATDTSMNISLGIHPYPSIDAASGTSNVKGYLVGGSSPSTAVRVSRITYATQVSELIPGAQLPQQRENATGVSNGENSYFSGDTGTYDFTSTYKLSHSNETTETLPSSAHSLEGGGGAGMGNQTLGYISQSNESRISKLTYATDTRTIALNVTSVGSPGNRTLARFGGESDTACYWIGGPSPSATGWTSDKWTFATETATLIPAADTGLYYGTKNNMGSGKNIFGYVAGTSGKSYIQKFNYAVDTQISTFNLSSNYTSGSWGISAQRFLNQSTQINAPIQSPTSSTTISRSIGSVPNTGYFGGGDPGDNNSIKRFNFSNETTSTIPATLSQSRDLTGGTSSITYGYFSGGRIAAIAFRSHTDRVTYSNDTAARIPGANTTGEIADCLGSGTRTFGILGGGSGRVFSSNVPRSYIQKLSFADETIARDGNLPESRQAGAVVTEPQTAGYFMAGTTPAGSDRSSVDKYTFSTSTGSVYPANTLLAKGYQTGMGSKTAGYVTGGPSGGGAGHSDVKKLTYSTSTWSTLSDTMSAGKYLGGGLNNTIFGVFCGGLPSNPRTEKVTFATETVARIPGADWASNWYRINGAGAQMNSAYEPASNLI